ncbi:cytochrome-c peroxidase, partial [Thiolapillus sp.]|uniref:cytochrome-c peroxidase n=2 Tax=Thiolapillus sp. TaxID=2017437 RepID=UPI003AF80FA3
YLHFYKDMRPDEQGIPMPYDRLSEYFPNEESAAPLLESIRQACLRPRDRFWDIPVPKIDSAFDNLLVPQPSWSPSTTQQLRKLVAAPYLAPNDWMPRSEAYFVFPLAQGTPGKQCGLAATGVYQPSLRSPWLAAKEVFGTDWPLIGDAWRAIAAFERTLVQRDTPLDKYLQGDKSALTEQQLRGMKLYNGKAGCIQCHNGELASDQDYYNIGVPPNKRWEEDGLAQVTFRFENYAKGQNEENYRTAKSDWGFYFRGKNQWDKGKFRTPSLRYTMYTAPYMHNGVFYTMEDVVDFYNRGGFDEDGRTTLFPETKSKLIKPLGLTDEEKEDLVAFLEAFSGEEIAMEKPKLPPYTLLFTKAELEAAQEAK